jgi:hypothetical protein
MRTANRPAAVIGSVLRAPVSDPPCPQPGRRRRNLRNHPDRSHTLAYSPTGTAASSADPTPGPRSHHSAFAGFAVGLSVIRSSTPRNSAEAMNTTWITTFQRTSSEV